MLDFILSLSITDSILITFVSGFIFYLAILSVKKLIITQYNDLIQEIDISQTKNNTEYSLIITGFTKDFERILNNYYSSVNYYLESNFNYSEISNVQFTSLAELFSRYEKLHNVNFVNTITTYHEFSDFKSLNIKEISSYLIHPSTFFDKYLDVYLSPLMTINGEIILKNYNLKISNKTKLLLEINSNILTLKGNIQLLSNNFDNFKVIVNNFSSLNIESLKSEIVNFSDQSFEGIQLYYGSFFNYLNEKIENICDKFNNFINISPFYLKKLKYNLSILLVKSNLNLNTNQEIVLLYHVVENYSIKFFREENAVFTFYLKKSTDKYELHPLDNNILIKTKYLRDLIYFYEDEKKLKYEVETPPLCVNSDLDEYEISVKGKLI